jgi:hypothetical protein
MRKRSGLATKLIEVRLSEAEANDFINTMESSEFEPGIAREAIDSIVEEMSGGTEHHVGVTTNFLSIVSAMFVLKTHKGAGTCPHLGFPQAIYLPVGDPDARAMCHHCFTHYMFAISLTSESTTCDLCGEPFVALTMRGVQIGYFLVMGGFCDECLKRWDAHFSPDLNNP